MAMTGFICQDTYLGRIAKLSDQEVGRLFRALMKYHATGETEELAGREGVAFDFIKGDIDSAEESYAQKCKQLRENRLGSLRQKLTDDNRSQETRTDDINCPQMLSDDNRSQQMSLENDNCPQNKLNINNIQKETSLKRGKEKALTRFSPPSVDEVRAYCLERGNSVDPEQFIDFYASKGWKVGDQPMKDWRACVRTWEKRESNGARQRAPLLPAQQYEQRSYANGAESVEDVYRRLQAQAEGSA